MIYTIGMILAFILTLSISTMWVLDGWTEGNSDRQMGIFMLVLVGTAGGWLTILGITVVWIVKKYYKKHKKEYS